jgi:diaminopimelate epimerase
MNFEQYHGTGNEFVVVVETDAPADPGAFAVEVCAERGVDGVLVLSTRAGDPPRVRMRLYQPDGSTAAMCGNGARCAARWARARTGATEFVIETPAGDRPATVDDETVTVGMGHPTFDPGAVPVARDDPLVDEQVGGYTVTAVNTGVPHAVAFVEDVDAVDVAADAPAVRHADVFPEGANATFATPDADGYRQRTFERGVEAETASCGTGAVAVAAVARRREERGDGWVRVSPPGGALDVRVTAEGASLRGPTEKVTEGDLEL